MEKTLCYTYLSDFTQVQSIDNNVGSDPLYLRYSSLKNVLNRYIEEEYRDFLSIPKYDEENGIINWCYDDNNQNYVRFFDLENQEQERYDNILTKTINYYSSVIDKTTDSRHKQMLQNAFRFVDKEFVFCCNDKVLLSVWGMKKEIEVIDPINLGEFKEYYKITFDAGKDGYVDGERTQVFKRNYVIQQKDIPQVELYSNDQADVEFLNWSPDPINHKVTNDFVFIAKYKKEQKKEYVTLTFVPDDNSSLNGVTKFEIEKGTFFQKENIPEVRPKKSYVFDKWSKDLDNPIVEDTEIMAICRQEELCQVNFSSSEEGEILGNNSFTISKGGKLSEDLIPKVKVKKGYVFKGWDKNTNSEINENITYIAQYEKEKILWYKRIFSKGCLKTLLWILLGLLLLLLLIFLLRSCKGCSGGHYDTNPEEVYIDKGDLGDNIDEGNGDNDYHIGTPLPYDDDDIIENPDGPDYVDGIVNLFFEDDNVDLNKFTKDFRKEYPDTKKYQMDYDAYVKRISISFPPEEREIFEKNVESKFSKKYKFIMIDEYVVGKDSYGDGRDYSSNAGWHLKATNTYSAWKLSKGKKDVVVAVVDDGCDINHPMLKGKIVKPYNVMTKSRTLTLGTGHGTHVAGCAVGYSQVNRGASGIAPNCSLMPVQVFQQGKPQTTISAQVSGIAYAIHNKADVVNISIGGGFAELSTIPEEKQIEISRTILKKLEKVWQRVLKLAEKNNVVLVFAAGNDNVVTNLSPNNRPSNIISVTAITPSLEKANFSDYGLGSTVSAPGVDIISSFPNGAYKSMDGTSMSAPIVAGAIALIKSVKKDLNAKQIIEILQTTGKTLSNKKVGKFIQIDRALAKASGKEIPDENEEDDSEYSTLVPPSDDFANVRRRLDRNRRIRDSINREIKRDEDIIRKRN